MGLLHFNGGFVDFSNWEPKIVFLQKFENIDFIKLINNNAGT